MAIDWTKIYKQYKGLWVALLDDQTTVVASGKTLKDAMKGAQAKGFNEPIVMRIPTEIAPYIG